MNWWRSCSTGIQESLWKRERERERKKTLFGGGIFIPFSCFLAGYGGGEEGRRISGEGRSVSERGGDKTK